MTPWARSLIDDAADLVAAGRHRSALGCLLTLLSVYPDDEEARLLAASLSYPGPGGDAPEPLTADDLRDSRLDSLFCSCASDGCTASWISAGALGSEHVQVVNPRGGRCERCARHFCRNHFGTGGTCPRCGVPLDHAPRTANGRPAMQTVRLNQPLVFVLVVREGAERIGSEFMTTLITNLSPDVFEDDASMQAIPLDRWRDDWQGLALALVARGHGDFLGDGYDLRFADGFDRAGTRWGIVKVFARMPKFVDPDAPSPSVAGPAHRLSSWGERADPW